MEATDNAPGEVAGKIEEYMQALTKNGRFSGSVLVARDGAIVHTAGYGFADREHGVVNTPRTKFRIGSITKQFTAMAILMLEEEGKLSVHDRVSKYLPYSPHAWSEITLHQLLNHTSGLRNLTNNMDHETTGRIPLSVREVIETFRAKPLEFKPGTEYRYCNSGYILLGDIIEHVSGISYEQFLRERIFDPLEMADSGYDHNDSVLPHRATGYGKPGGRWVRSGYCDMGFPSAAGALYSTVEDLYRWDQALGAGRLISKESYARMTLVTPLISSYGYGVLMGREYKRRVVKHAGGINGFRGNFIRFPDEPACVVVLCNSEVADFTGASKNLAAILFGENYTVPTVKAPAALSDEVISRYSGTYEFLPGVSVQVGGSDGRLRLTAGKVQTEFLPESETVFFREESGDGVTFYVGEDGAVTHLVLRQDDAEAEARKV